MEVHKLILTGDVLDLGGDFGQIRQEVQDPFVLERDELGQPRALEFEDHLPVFVLDLADEGEVDHFLDVLVQSVV